MSEPELSRSGIVGISRSRTGLYGHSRVSWCWFLFSLDSEVSANHLDDTGILVYRFTIESQQSVRRDLLNSIVVGAVTTSGRVVSADLQARRGARGAGRCDGEDAERPVLGDGVFSAQLRMMNSLCGLPRCLRIVLDSRDDTRHINTPWSVGRTTYRLRLEVEMNFVNSHILDFGGQTGSVRIKVAGGNQRFSWQARHQWVALPRIVDGKRAPLSPSDDGHAVRT